MRNSFSRQFLLIACFFSGSLAMAQVPLPGQSGLTSTTQTPALQPAAIPGQYVGGNTVNTGTTSPLPGATGTYNQASARGGSEYRNLPISVEDAKARVEELKNLVQISRPQDVQDRVTNTSDWLNDLADAHNKLANVFGRQDTMKAQSNTERNTAQKFSHLRNEVQLLKADLLIKQNRVPEALNPLVEIVVNEPKGSAGNAAYHKLKEIGFAEDVPEPVASEAVAPVPNASQPPASTGQHIMVSVKATPVNARAQTGALKVGKRPGVPARTTTVTAR